MSVWDDFQDLVGGQQNASIVAIAVSFFLVIATTLGIWLLRGSRSKGRAILLIGLNGAGKTLIYSQLRYKKEKHTVMSVDENKGKLAVGNGNKPKVVDLVDIPGHDSMRSQLIDKYLPSARGIVFVVDSGSFSKELRDVAKLLYSLLASSLTVRNRLPVVVACNKQDIATAKSAKLVRQMLEKEIDALRTTRAAALSDTDDRTANTVAVGRDGKEFAFGDVLPVRVEVVECCAKPSAVAAADDRSTDLNEVLDWITAQA